MVNLPETEQLTRGLLIFNNNADVSNEIVNKIAATHNAELLSYLNENNTLDELTRNSFYKIYELPTEQRIFTIIHLNMNKLREFQDIFVPLISESRHLKIIFIIEINDITNLEDSIANTLFGNIPNYIIGNFSEEERKVFNKLTNNILMEEKLNTLISYINKDTNERKNIPLIN